MQLIKYIFFIILFFISLVQVKSNTIDSLLAKIHNSADTTKIKIYYKLSVQYRASSEDSAVYFLKKMIAVADNLFLKYKNDTTKNELLLFVKKAYSIANDDFYYRFEKFEELLKLSKKELEIAKSLNDSSWIGNVYNTIGNVYKFRSDYETALVYYQKSLNIKKMMSNKRGIAYAYIGIANVFINWRKFPEALKNYNYCYKYASEIQDTIGLAAASVGMGNVYAQVENLTNALIKYKDAYKYYLALKDTEGIGLSLLSLGDLFRETKELEKSKEKYLEALNLMLKKNVKIRIALIYHQLGEIDFIQKNYVEAIFYFKESLKYSLETNYKKITSTNYQSLSLAYRELNQYKLAYDFLYKFYNLNDSIFNEEKHKQLEEIETKYQTAKKEKIIKQQKFKIEKEQVLNDKRTAQRNFIAIGLLLLLGLFFFVFRSYRIKKKSNQLLIKQKAIIQEQNEELNQQNEEISAQRDEISSQKNKIEFIYSEVSKSIDYAKRLQQAILSSDEILKLHTSDHFIFFQPKDKVSGDFYWWAHIENHTIITAADCTGHGVPGAFMSMLGISFLREIVNKEYITHPGVILRRLRKEVIRSLQQKGESGEQKDGMDMAIITIDHQTNIVQFSGANNPLYIVTSEKLKVENSDAVKVFDNSNLAIQNSKLLYEVKPDKMPIAIYERMDKFATHELPLEKGDQLYMFSDGFADQFGGPKGKKFKYKPFKQLIMDNCQLSMAEQKFVLEKTFAEWKGNIEQVDDVLVLGIKI